MSELNNEIVGLIFQLMPGFISTWLFYTLTSYIKPDTFERVIQAFIYTVITKASVVTFKSIALWLGKFYSFGPWNADLELVYLVCFATIIGLIASWCANNDFPLSILRRDGIESKSGITKTVQKFASKLNLTNKTLHPTEWFSFFFDSNYPAILHLESGQRLLGRLSQFPDSPHSGHFIVVDPNWIDDNGILVPLPQTQKILISSSEVTRVELLKI